MSKWQEYSDKFIALTQREKVIILCTCLFLATYGLYFILIEPVLDKQNALQKRQVSMQSQIQEFRDQIGIIQAALSEDPNKEIKADIVRLNRQLAGVDAKLKDAMSQYVSPEQMARRLTALLQTSPAVRVTGLTVEQPTLIEVDNQLVEMSDESKAGHISDVQQSELPQLYTHEFTLTVKGSYFDLMNFVKSVVNNNKQFAVDDLKYEVLTHPEASLTLSLITISDSENVIRL